MKYNYP